MGKWSFLKKTEFWVTTIIAIVLTFAGGFLSGKSYIINGEFAELQNEYNLLNSSYNKLIAQNSQGIFTQNQQGDNLFVNQVPPKREFNEDHKRELISKIPTDKALQIQITSVMGDNNAFEYANDVYNYLKLLNYNVSDGIAQVLYSQPVIGQRISVNEDGSIDIIIGAQE